FLRLSMASSVSAERGSRSRARAARLARAAVVPAAAPGVAGAAYIPVAPRAERYDETNLRVAAGRGRQRRFDLHWRDRAGHRHQRLGMEAAGARVWRAAAPAARLGLWRDLRQRGLSHAPVSGTGAARLGQR